MFIGKSIPIFNYSILKAVSVHDAYEGTCKLKSQSFEKRMANKSTVSK